MIFWTKLKKPFFCVAPMYDVTDAPFRQIIAKYGKFNPSVGGPDVMFTEFVSADGLLSKGKDVLKQHLIFSETERPIVAQLFGSKPETIKKACELVVKMGFDGIDINMGCPDKSVLKQGAGAELIKNPKLARQIICSAKEGAGEIPVSIKTRIGYNKNEIEKWLPELLAENPVTITIHARTKKEMSKVPADWSVVMCAVEIRDSLKSKTLIIGNGDVKSRKEGLARAKETGCDGIMIGRGFFGKPWLLNENFEPTTEQKLKILLEHTKLFVKIFGDGPACAGRKHFDVMKKHFKAYVNGWDGAKELRTKLMETKNAKDVEKIIHEYLKN
ncbi:MAG: tRNA-dihydrouridine synthase [Parcubacteria group bacterium Athens0714_16]|nr:MAG: tRNA-dihydrouridine synthase [Parcubacteria group bacterium Athens0714_16]